MTTILLVPQGANFLLDSAWKTTVVLNPGRQPYVIFERDYEGGAARIEATTTGLYKWSWRIGALIHFGGSADLASQAWKAMGEAIDGAAARP